MCATGWAPGPPGGGVNWPVGEYCWRMEARVSRTCPALGGRRDDSFSRHQRMSSSSSGGTSGRTDEGTRGASSTCIHIVWRVFSPRKTRSPVTNSKSTQPMA